MANTFIGPSTYLLFIDPAGGTDYQLAGCLTKHTYTLGNNEIEAKTMCGTEKFAGTQDYGISFDGNIIVSPDATHLGHYDLLTLTANRTNFSWKIGKATPVSGDVTITGDGFFSKYDSTHDAENPGSFSGQIGISAAPTYVETV